jgi:lipoprotein-releasing system permease protein
MNLPYFIAAKLIKGRREGTSFSRPINVIAIAGIALGLAVMIIAVATLTGFKKQITDKVVGFGSHIQLLNLDSNISFETNPVTLNDTFLTEVKTQPGVKHVQAFATKAGIIKTDEQIQGVVLKGIGPDFDWSYFRSNMTDGSVFMLSDTATSASTKVIISSKIASLLKLKTGDSFAMHFIQDPPRMRKFTISGIYETSLEEFDKIFVFCDIRNIRRLNGWEDNQVSGLEVFIDDFDNLAEITENLAIGVGYRIDENQVRVKVTNIVEKYPQIFDWLNFQDLNVVIIITLMLLVAGFNMISGLLILILEKTNMIGVLKALGSEDKMIRRVFLYQAAYLIAKGLFWGNLIGLGLAFFQLKTGLISLNPATYYLKTVPINLSVIHLLLLNAGTMTVILFMLLIPSQLVSRIMPVKAIKFD